MEERGLEQALSSAMRRFHDFFLGAGYIEEKNVHLRRRDDFAAPLVTVFGHTYGVRLRYDSTEAAAKNPVALEASVNVYDDEFSLDRFRAELEQAYETTSLEKLVRNFATPEEDGDLANAVTPFPSFFSPLDLQEIELVSKDKSRPSRITGRLVDSILRVPYRPTEQAWRRFRKDEAFFASVVYLYCLRPFVAAYRKGLRLDPPTAR